jgi:hypothetical protein
VSSYDALLGRILDNGEEVELRGGLNFIGVTITENESLNCLNITFTGAAGETGEIPFSAAGVLDFDASFTFTGGNLLTLPAGSRVKSSVTLIMNSSTDVHVAADAAGANPTLLLRPGGVGGRVGFYGTTPIAKQVLSGDRSDGTALTNLITLLAALGLLSDETSA